MLHHLKIVFVTWVLPAWMPRTFDGRKLQMNICEPIIKQRQYELTQHTTTHTNREVWKNHACHEDLLNDQIYCIANA